MSKKVFPETQDIPRHGSGDLLEDRFGLMMKHEEFHDQRPLDKAKWTSEKQIRCADKQWARGAAIARQFYDAVSKNYFNSNARCAT